MLPRAILIKLMDVANYRGNIFNCISALKRIKSEFPSLCLRTIRDTHSAALFQHRYIHLESTLLDYSQLPQTLIGVGISGCKKVSVISSGVEMSLEDNRPVSEGPDSSHMGNP